METAHTDRDTRDGREHGVGTGGGDDRTEPGLRRKQECRERECARNPLAGTCPNPDGGGDQHDEPDDDGRGPVTQHDQRRPGRHQFPATQRPADTGVGRSGDGSGRSDDDQHVDTHRGGRQQSREPIHE